MERSTGPDRSKDTPAKPVSASRGLDESLEDVPVARRELTAILPPPAPTIETLSVSHSKGPWHVDDGAIYTDDLVRVADTNCDVDQEGLTDAIAGRNAILLAAAPELLEALETLVGHVLHYAAMPHASSLAHKDAAQARAAIAKARAK